METRTDKDLQTDLTSSRLPYELIFQLWVPSLEGMGWRTSRLGHWKIPLMGDGGDITGADSQTVETENSHDRRANRVARLGNLHMNHSRPYESMWDVNISIPRVVRVVRTIRLGLSRSANALRPLADTSTTKSRKSSLQIGAFAINHPILAMLALGLIALIGFVCIFELPTRWLPF